jgi:hypothetical protein
VINQTSGLDIHGLCLREVVGPSDFGRVSCNFIEYAKKNILVFSTYLLGVNIGKILLKEMTQWPQKLR